MLGASDGDLGLVSSKYKSVSFPIVANDIDEALETPRITRQSIGVVGNADC